MEADSLIANPIVRALGKPAEEFTKADLMHYVTQKGITGVNLRYVAGDGRLKALNFVVQNRAHLDRILSLGERVDGSSLFPFVAAESSDLYVVPRYRTAFVNPFTERPTLDVLCSFYDVSGNPLESAPENILHKAQDSLQRRTGHTLEALGELEYYTFSEVDDIFPVVEQRGYHESTPFSKWVGLRREAVEIMVQMGCSVKYSHAEVGNIVHEDRQMVQQEIEFLPTPIEQSADQLAVAKWVLREVAYRYGKEVSFAPKIIVGHAGSGMHVHSRLMKDGRNVLTDDNGLTDEARRLVAGYLMHARSLSAFGNTVPTSFLRLVPHQEAPTSICWGERNRSALVRVPLGWQGVDDRMVRHANPLEPPVGELPNGAQTVELRSPDGSANVHLLLAGMAVAARRGLEDDRSLDFAERTHITGEAGEHRDLEQLPASCAEAADALMADRGHYEDDGVFPEGLLEAHAEVLRSYGDRQLSEDLEGNHEAIAELVARHFHCG